MNTRYGFPPPRGLLAIAAALTLGACATLPSNGPTGAAVRRAERAPGNVVGFRIVPIDQALIDRLTLLPAVENATPLLAMDGEGRIDQIGSGDVLNVDIFEVGTSLFARNGQSLGGDSSVMGSVPVAGVEPIGGVVVDGQGAVTLPYIGHLIVAGHTTDEIGRMIEQRLRGLSQRPQAVVTVRQNVTNTVYVMGNVQRPGRLGLSSARETILDALALAGGAGTQPQDMIIRFTRGRRSVEVQLQDIRAGSPEDLVLIPGDKIEVIHQPRSFTVLGAANKVAQVPFDTRTVSLAEAVARAGGPSDGTADARSVFVVRYEPQAIAPDGAAPARAPGTAPTTRPIIYQLNLFKPGDYFLAQHFAMRDKDVIYVANAPANQPAKLVQIISQLFTPVIIARQLTQ